MSLFSDITDDITSLVQKSAVHARYKTTLIEKLKKMGIGTAGQLIAHVPVAYENRTHTTPLAQASADEKMLVRVRIERHDFVRLKRRGRLLKVLLRDESGCAELHCYGREFLQRVLPLGSEIDIWGKFTRLYGRLVSSDFEVVREASRKGAVVPRYKLHGTGISQGMFLLCVKTALENTRIANLRDGASISRQEACRMMHLPHSLDEAEEARRYFAFDELLLFQLSMQYGRAKKTTTHQQKSKDTTQPHEAMQSPLLHAFVSALPFALNAGQIQSINEISYDMHQSMHEGTSMRRMLQGDVGAGKTVVALCVALFSLGRGGQVCFAVPSEALALQHFSTIAQLCESVKIQPVLVTGSMGSAARKKAYEQIADGSAQLVVGTHALYSPALQYKDLRLAVIDEQHRFGIEQRATLLAKGENVHALFMSATPIPRTLALTLYSNLDISTLTELPSGRAGVRTRLVLHEKSTQVYSRVKQKLAQGEQAFFVFPAIEDAEREEAEEGERGVFEDAGHSAGIASASAMHPLIEEALKPYSVALLHSKVAAKERERIVRDFARGKISALVSTTIIEIGIDVPQATTMCVFDADRFGLATLHQLRGRVGRGSLMSEAIFVYRKPISELATQRLKVLYEERDGFVIAERDLLLRGPGDINQLGIRQSGSALFEFFDMAEDASIIDNAHKYARHMLMADPHLSDEKHALMRAHVLARGHALV